jgi:hypothetical protein
MGRVLFRERGFFCNVAVGVIDVSVFTKTGLAGHFLRRPAAEVLYAGLSAGWQPDRRSSQRGRHTVRREFRRQTHAGLLSGERANPVRQTRKNDRRLDSASQLRLYSQIPQSGIVDGKAGAARLAAGKAVQL